MPHILEEDAHMRARIGSHELLVRIGFPGEPLNVGIGAHLDEALSPFVAAVPEVLHDPQHPNVCPCDFMKRFRAAARARALPVSRKPNTDSAACLPATMA
jgi:hypothetical protein